MIRSEQKKELLFACQTILDSAPNFDFEPLPFYVSYLVCDLNGNVLATNDPFLPVLPDSRGRVKKFVQKGFFTDGDLAILYFSLEQNEMTAICAISLDGGVEERLFSGLPLAILFAIFPIIAFSFLLSFFLTRRVLRPVGELAKSAERISSSNLGELLPVRGTGDELDEIAIAFNALFARLKSDFERERQFTSDVSHELKTPVAVILGQANLLLRWGKDDPAQLQKSLESIRKEARSMQAITANLLQLSRLENSRVEIKKEETDILKLLFRIQNEFSTIAPNLKIKIDGNATANTDSELLHQVLTAVVSNSVKYAGESCEIFAFAEKNGDDVLISLTDNGDGFPEDAINKVFDRFFRADEAHSRTGGSGLGLAISRAIVRSLGGEIRAENADGGGARIIIKIPA